MTILGNRTLTTGRARPVIDENTATTREVPVPDVEFTRPSDGVSEIVLNRPDRRNALTSGAVAEFCALLDDLGDETAVLVLRGAGGCFCSGIDLAELPPSGDWPRQWEALHTRLAALDIPVVAALERAAVNAGASLALAADLMIAGEGSFLQTMEVSKGMVAWANTAWLIARHGAARALDLTLTGRRLDGAELYRLGLAHACVPDAEVLPAARALAAGLASHPRDAVAAAKQLIRTLQSAGATDPATAIATARTGR